MAKPDILKDIVKTTDETRFDNRLIEKRIEHGFLTESEKAQFLKGLKEESEFEFTSMETIEAEVEAANNQA